MTLPFHSGGAIHEAAPVALDIDIQGAESNVTESQLDERFLGSAKLGGSKWIKTHEECKPAPKNATFAFYVYHQKYPPILGRWYAEILQILRRHPKRVRDPENATHFFPALDVSAEYGWIPESHAKLRFYSGSERWYREEVRSIPPNDPATAGRVHVTAHLRNLKYWKNHSCQHVLFDMTDYPVPAFWADGGIYVRSGWR